MYVRVASKNKESHLKGVLYQLMTISEVWCLTGTTTKVNQCFLDEEMEFCFLFQRKIEPVHTSKSILTDCLLFCRG